MQADQALSAACHPAMPAAQAVVHAAPSLGTVCINGRFLAQRGSGVQRFAWQLVLALDAALAERGGDARRWRLLLPPGVAVPVPLAHIETCSVGGLAAGLPGHLWDQWLRFAVQRGDLLVNLANSGPVFRGRSISVLHDAAVYRTPHNFTRTYRLFHQALGRLLARSAVIGTVSQFSRAELAATLGLDAQRIFVVPNSCEHLQAVEPDWSVLPRLGLQPNRFFLTIGSPVPNKNLRAAVQAFCALAAHDERLVIVGAVDAAVFGQGLTAAEGPGASGLPPGVVRAGAIGDASLKALLQSATALVFPSLYEGFGIPPLEAMSNGCPVIASRIAPVVEVCGDAALYFDPARPATLTDALRQARAQPEVLADLVERGRRRAGLYSWHASAQRLLEVVDGMA